MIEVRRVESCRKDYLGLLLLADEQESMIDRYLERGDMFALYEDGGLRSVCVVTREGDGVCELKNIATLEEWQGRGYGGTLLRHIISFYEGKCETMIVGTGDTPRSLRFYERNGFTRSHRVINFFTDNYDHIMVEDGAQLVDMVYLRRRL